MYFSVFVHNITNIPEHDVQVRIHWKNVVNIHEHNVHGSILLQNIVNLDENNVDVSFHVNPREYLVCEIIYLKLSVWI